MEHRWGERVKVDIPVRITGHPFTVRQGRLIDLSVSGASIKADFGLRPLTRVLLALELPRRMRCDAPSIAAYVTRSAKDGIGIEWCEFSPAQVTELLQSFAARRYVRSRRGEASSTVGVSRLSAPLLKHGT